MRRGLMWWLLLLLLLQPLTIPVGAATWEEDGWLSTGYANERLTAGDEFGCYGMPDLSWQADAGAVAIECRDYLLSRIRASQWSAEPLSTYTPKGLTYIEHAIVDGQGFPVHGDETGLADSAWADDEDQPEQPEDWYNLGRRGGSLEKEMNSLGSVQLETEKGGLLNFYWIGQVDDITIRHDSLITEWLGQSDAWFTTWGEAWSMWTIQRCHQFDYETRIVDSQGKWKFAVSRPSACLAIEQREWPVPVTWRVNASLVNATEVIIKETGELLPVLDVSENQLQQGWRMDEGHLLLSIPVAMTVEITFEETGMELDILDEQWFNGRSFAVTIASHQTEDLFTWSKRFEAEDALRFTWLVTPRDARASSAWLPVVGVVVILASMLAYTMLIKRDERVLPEEE